MKMQKKLVSVLAVSMLCAGLLSGCGDGTTTPTTTAAAIAETAGSGSEGAESAEAAESTHEEKMFHIALTAGFTGFDPLRTNDSASTYVNAQMYETLYRIDPVTGEYNCLLAAEYPEFSEDGMTATIKLREGVTFHDGTPFNAEAVKYTIELIKDPNFGSARASIANSIDEVECPDDYTVVMHLAYEDGVLLAKLAHTNSAIVSPTAQQSQDLMVDPCGTGPYRFVSSVSGSEVVLTRNDDYWGDKPAIKDVTMTYISEESTAVARMETGEADFMPNLSVEQLDRVNAMESVTAETSEAAQIYYMALRGDSYVNPVMAEKDFRIALAKAIDKEGYVANILEGYADPAKSIIGPKITGYDEEATTHNIDYDPEGAKAILDANPGWADEEILFLVPSTPAYTKMGEYFQANLKAAGFNNIKIETIDWTAWLTESKVDNRFDITLAAWSNVTRDGSELMEPNFHSVNGAQRLRIPAEDAEVIDAYIEASKTTSDMSVRTENLLLTNAMLQDNAYVQPIYHNTNMYCYNKAYTGITRDAGGTFYVMDFDYAE
ncbi:MAG: ABC transporter substrate-binding protein [Clostridiales bacterium]|nr:ABC transporter substrate-binding protein [Clostridiales bacterium]